MLHRDNIMVWYFIQRHSFLSALVNVNLKIGGSPICSAGSMRRSIDSRCSTLDYWMSMIGVEVGGWEEGPPSATAVASLVRILPRSYSSSLFLRSSMMFSLWRSIADSLSLFSLRYLISPGRSVPSSGWINWSCSYNSVIFLSRPSINSAMLDPLDTNCCNLV